MRSPFGCVIVLVGCSGTMAEEVRALSVLLLCHKVRSISAPSRVAYARWNTSWRNVSLPYSAVHQQCEVPQYLGADHECTVGCVSFIAVPSHRAKAAFMG